MKHAAYIRSMEGRDGPTSKPLGCRRLSGWLRRGIRTAGIRHHVTARSGLFLWGRLWRWHPRSTCRSPTSNADVRALKGSRSPGTECQMLWRPRAEEENTCDQDTKRWKGQAGRGAGRAEQKSNTRAGRQAGSGIRVLGNPPFVAQGSNPPRFVSQFGGLFGFFFLPLFAFTFLFRFVLSFQANCLDDVVCRSKFKHTAGVLSRGFSRAETIKHMFTLVLRCFDLGEREPSAMFFFFSVRCRCCCGRPLWAMPCSQICSRPGAGTAQYSTVRAGYTRAIHLIHHFRDSNGRCSPGVLCCLLGNAGFGLSTLFFVVFVFPRIGRLVGVGGGVQGRRTPVDRNLLLAPSAVSSARS